MQTISEDRRKGERTEAQKASLTAAREKAKIVRRENADLKQAEKELKKVKLSKTIINKSYFHIFIIN